MTREEAIARIKDHKIVHKMNEPRAIYISKALGMAIEVLEQEPCEDAISRQAVIDKAVYTETEEGWSGRTVDVKVIEALPPVTPQPKTGRWIKTINENGITSAVRCSECGFEDNRYMLFRYCPNCGVKMLQTDLRSKDGK